MNGFARELLAIERSGFNARAGVLGIAVLGVFALAMIFVGPVAMAAAIGALVVLSADPPPPGRAWAVALLPPLVGGAALTFLSVSIGGNAVAGAVIGGIVALAATLQAGRGKKAGARGLIATMWVILAMTLYDSGVTALEYTVAFAVGGGAGAVVTWLRTRSDSPEGTGSDDLEAGSGAAPAPYLETQLLSPLGVLAVLRGIGIGLGIWIGFTYFPDHAAWVAITSVIVIRPPTHQAVVVGLQRSLGTGVGVIVAVALAGVVGQSSVGLAILFLATAFFMMSVREVNYALFAMLGAALVVFLQRIVQGGVAETALERLEATVIGVLVAFVVLAFVDAFDRRRRAAG